MIEGCRSMERSRSMEHLFDRCSSTECEFHGVIGDRAQKDTFTSTVLGGMTDRRKEGKV